MALSRDLREVLAILSGLPPAGKAATRTFAGDARSPARPCYERREVPAPAQDRAPVAWRQRKAANLPDQPAVPLPPVPRGAIGHHLCAVLRAVSGCGSAPLEPKRVACQLRRNTDQGVKGLSLDLVVPFIGLAFPARVAASKSVCAQTPYRLASRAAGAASLARAQGREEGVPPLSRRAEQFRPKAASSR